MVEHTGAMSNFAGFMANEAMANWLAIQAIFNDGKEMVGKERSCLFHWKESLKLHTDRYIVSEFKDTHLAMCNKWRIATNSSDALGQFLAWWATCKAIDKNIHKLESWLGWWHHRASR